MWRLTRRGVAVLVLSVLLGTGGYIGGFPVLWVLGVVLLGAVVSAVVVTIWGVRVEVSRSVYPDRVERGQPALARLQVRNSTANRQPPFLATDRSAGGSRTIQVRALPAGGEAVYHYELATAKRGKAEVGPLTLLRTDPFGLAVHRVPTGETATLWVHPRRLAARALVDGHPRHHHEGATTDDALRGSVDLQDVREYSPGDEVRHLHWKATARTGRLMVRDMTDPRQPRFTLLLDNRRGVLSADGFEEAVDVAASLLVASALAGHHSRLVTATGMDVPTAGGPAAARRLLDDLCELGQGGDVTGTVMPAVLSASRGSGGGSLVVVSSGVAEPAALSLMRRRFGAIFLIALSDTARGQGVVAGANVMAAATAVEAVRRWNEIAT